MGDTLYGSGVNAWSNLTAGAQTQHLAMGATVPAWAYGNDGGVQTLTGTVTLTAASPSLNLCDTSGGAVSVTLPAASACPGKIFTFINIAGSNGATVNRAGSDVFSAANTSLNILTTLPTTVQSDGTATWWNIGMSATGVPTAGTQVSWITAGKKGVAAISLAVPVVIASGGTNNTSLGVTNGGINYMDGTRMQTSAAGTSGQVLTSGGAGAPTWTLRAMAAYTSASAVALGTTYTIAHSLGRTPAAVSIGLICIDNGGEAGYAKDDIVFGVRDYTAYYNSLGCFSLDATNVVVRTGATGTWYINGKSDWVATALTLAKWKLYVLAT